MKKHSRILALLAAGLFFSGMDGADRKPHTFVIFKINFG